LLKRLRDPWPDNRAERTLGAVSLLIAAGVLAMIVFVAIRAWPMFQHNGFSWLLGGGGAPANANSNQRIDPDAIPTGN